ncbi:MAG TPA: MlaD family protein [Candidatus Binatia bacterium]
MARKALYFKIGLFVTSAATIGVLAVIILGAGAVFRKKFIMETYIKESVQGLDVGSAVKFRGVQIGNVEEINIVGRVYQNASRLVLVRVSLFPDVFRSPAPAALHQNLEKNIEDGLRVRLASQGVTGTAYIEADFLDPKRNPPLQMDWTPEYPYVPSAASTITRLVDSVEQFFITMEKVDIEGISSAFEQTLKLFTELAGKANVENIGTQFERLLAEARDTNRRINGILNETEIRPILSDTQATVAAARRIVEGAERPLSNVLADLPQTSTRLKELASQLGTATDGLPESVALLNRTLRRLDQLVSSRQQDVEVTIENLRQISANLKEFSENAKKYPAQILFGEPPKPAATGNGR